MLSLGSQLSSILDAHPACRGIHLPNVVAEAPANPRIERVGGDFFEDIPGTAMWEYEVQIMQEVAAVIDLLAKRQGHYKFDEDQVRFEEQSDADIFNAHMTKVGELGQAQSEIRKRATTEALNNLDATR